MYSRLMSVYLSGALLSSDACLVFWNVCVCVFYFCCRGGEGRGEINTKQNNTKSSCILESRPSAGFYFNEQGVSCLCTCLGHSCHLIRALYFRSRRSVSCLCTCPGHSCHRLSCILESRPSAGFYSNEQGVSCLCTCMGRQVLHVCVPVWGTLVI